MSSNPITVYSLIQLSELVAQNERTLFTFISDTDDNSLNSFIQTNNDGLFNVDKIYDYFSPLMKREEGNEIRNIWYRTEGTLSRIENQLARRIVKTLAVILMINDTDSFPANEKSIALATMLSKDTVTSLIDDIIDQRFLRRNIINNLLTFATTNNKEIEDQISSISQTKRGSVSFDSVLDEINESKYLLPRRYNEQNKITRFYKVSFITEDQLNSLSSFEIYKERGFADGLVLNLIRIKMDEKQIVKKFTSFDESRVVLKYPNKPINSVLFDELMRYVSLQEILLKGGNDEVVTNEIELLLQEATEDVRVLINDYFDNDYSYVSTAVTNTKRFQDLISDQMDCIYPKRIIFNNELVNKNTVTTVYQKAVNNVIEDLINHREYDYSETSPETTIKTSVINAIQDQNDAIFVVDEIKTAIIQAEKEKLAISEIVDKYTDAPYGIRKGILPLLIAKCINELSNNVLLYLKNKEIDMTASNLVKAVNTDGDYYFRSSKGTIAQEEYLHKMLKVFVKEPSHNFRIDTKSLSEEYRKFFVGLPMVIRNENNTDNKLGLSPTIISYKKCFLSFGVNPYEVVFDKPLALSGSYDVFLEEVLPFIEGWQEKLTGYLRCLILLPTVI